MFNKYRLIVTFKDLNLANGLRFMIKETILIRPHL